MRGAPPHATPLTEMNHRIWHTVGVVDDCGRFLIVGRQAPDALGIGIESLEGRAFTDLLAPADRPAFAAALANAAAGEAHVVTSSHPGRQEPLSYRLTGTHDRRARNSVLVEVQVGTGGARPSVGIEAAPRETMRADSAGTETPTELGVPSTARASRSQPAPMHETAAELDALLRALPDLFFRFDVDGRFLDFSAPGGSSLYAPPGEFLGKRPIDVMPPGLALAMEGARAETHARGALVTMEYELDVAGGVRHFEARYVPFIDGQTIAVVRDVTERRQAERALLASEARLRESQKVEAVGRLAGGVAHDFNNLLMIISGYTSAIARQVPPEHPSKEALEEIRKASDQANALTRQLLALSRQEAAHPTLLDLGDILADMHNMLGRALGDGIRLSVSVTPALPRIRADRSQLERIVLNLVLNCHDALPQGGAVSISATCAGTGVALAVSDDGQGMDEPTRQRVFEPFFTTRPRGNGLGLYTVEQMVVQCRGSIEVQSQPGAGTRVIINLPAAG